ncbi:MAG: maleylacetoacetate isomerase [Betaproteobacteria bacterium]|nr:maleylacetoacetate isomerase [Betaproteobacteria bacterium]
MIVYGYFRSSASYRLRIALNLKGLAPEMRFVHLLKGEQHNPAYREVNPQGFVPYFIDGDFQLSQSMAIIEYLDETHPEPPLLPKDPRDRALVRQIAQIVACDIHPLNNTRILTYLSKDLKVSDEQKAQWYCRWIHDGFSVIEGLLATRKDRFCVGDTPTLADICLIPQVANAARFKCSMEPFPLIAAINQRALELPAFAAAHPLKQPDAE